MCPSLIIGWGCLGHAHRELLEDATEELVVCKLYCVDHDVVAQFNDHELLLLRTWTEHVPVFLRREDRGGGLSRTMSGMHSGGAVCRCVVETVDNGNTELRGEAFIVLGDVRCVLLATALSRPYHWARGRRIVRASTIHAVFAYGRFTHIMHSKRRERWMFPGFTEPLGLPVLERDEHIVSCTWLHRIQGSQAADRRLLGLWGLQSNVAKRIIWRRWCTEDRRREHQS